MTERAFVARTGEDLGRAVGEIRRVRGLTQQQLAAQAGIERTRVAKLEVGARSTVVLVQLMRLLRHLGATVTITFDDDAEGQDREPHGARGAKA